MRSFKSAPVLSVFVSPAGSPGCSVGPVPGPEVGDSLRPRRGGGGSCSAGSGGAGRCDEEVPLPRTKAGEKDPGPVVEFLLTRRAETTRAPAARPTIQTLLQCF